MRRADRAIRAALPLTLAVVGVAVAGWLEPVEVAGLLLLGAAGSLAVALADRRSALTAWRRRFGGLSFRGVRRFPREERGVAELVRICAAVEAVLQEVDVAARSGRPARRRAAGLRRRLDGLVALGATLTVHRERLSPELDGSDAAREMVDRQLEELVPAALQLRATLMRSGALERPQTAALSDLRHLEGRLRAEVDCAEELGRLEERWTFAS
jgi:hypothetical protein